jgi:ubiquinone biosynthesis protein UbiJ
MINKILSLDPESYQKLKKLHHKTVQLELIGLPINIYFLFTKEGVRILNEHDAKPDIVMRGTPSGFMKLRLQDTPNLYNSDVKIIGDMGLADELRKIFSQLDIDWEAGVANFTGDVAAHHIGQVVRHGLAFAKKAHDNLQQDLKEYYQEEIRWLPAREEMTQFAKQVSVLRDQVERLEARVKQCG